MKNARLLSGALLVIVAGQTGTGSGVMSQTAADYLNHALDLMQKHALHRKEIDWQRLRRAAIAYSKDAQTPSATYPAIVYACTQLKDHSSHLQQPVDTPVAIQIQSRTTEITAQQAAHGRRLTSTAPSPFLARQSFLLAMLKHGDRHYAYLVVPFSERFHTEYADPRLRHKWAEELYSLVSNASQQGVQGWILDLRGNTGGYLAPMLAGLQPLLGNGEVLNFRGPDTKHTMSIKDGASLDQFGFGHTSTEERIDENVQLTQ
jgi:carboxyl-terminal processing protease